MIKDVEPLLKECEETLTDLLRLGNIEVACYVQGFINSINKLPDVKKSHGEWIPCSSRLPDGCGELLITADYNGTLVTYSAWFNTLINEFERVPQEHIVLAWMPLPEPYKEEGKDMSAEKSNMPEFEWVCPDCGGKEYDANSLCLECGCRMISREVTKNDKLS